MCLLVSQPRRLSAVSLAERVAFERCETVGGTVGYFIRLDAHISPATRLLFCTTGILMRHLNVDPQLSGVNYIVLDEVHEREAYVRYLSPF